MCHIVDLPLLFQDVGNRVVICSNGMVIRETKTEIRDIHNEYLDLDRIPEAIRSAMELVEHDVRRLQGWEEAPLIPDQFRHWINGTLADRWGRKAACRAYHICMSGQDVEYEDPFAKGHPTDKPVKRIGPVPGAPPAARNLYEVSQALSWIATGRANPEERLGWQSAVPELIQALAAV